MLTHVNTHGCRREVPCGAFWAGQEAEKEKGMGIGSTAGLGGTAKVRYEKTGTARSDTLFPRLGTIFLRPLSRSRTKNPCFKARSRIKNLTSRAK